MAEAIENPKYWKLRLHEAEAKSELWKSVFICNRNKWNAIEAKHREILTRVIGNDDDILDCGCGYGRVPALMPKSWSGYYLGLDLSPDFINLAQLRFPTHTFMVADLRDLRWLGESPSSADIFDWAILISIRPMIRRHLGDEVWARMEEQIRRCAVRLLYLEYDETDEGSIE